MSDRKVLHIITSVATVALLLAMVLPGDHSGRYVSAFILLVLAVIAFCFIKKRSILSIKRKEVIVISAIFGALYLTIYYLTGLSFGFVKNIYSLNASIFFRFVVPITVIIIASEVLRHIVCAQNNKMAETLCYISCVLAETLIYGNIHYINSFNRFMEFVGLTFFPAIVANLLYNYFSKRYGMAPNIVYRLVTTLYLYFIPVVTKMADSLFAIYNLAFPLLVYGFVDFLYEKKRKQALRKRSKVSVPVTVAIAAVIIAFVMLISNQFRFGTLIIATPSMTGELNVGDATIFEKYEDQPIEKGQVIVFEKNGSMVVHRVVDIQTVNGITRYFTKGDANDDIDADYIVRSNIVGLVKFKLPYLGYPTLWLRSLFNM